MNQNQTPILDALEAFISQKPAYFNIPGHRMEKGISERWTRKVGTEIFAYDLTEAEGLDDLHNPSGAIRAAQELAAEAFGAEKTWFLVNGTTCGNEAMVLSAAREGEKILVPRNAHKSVLMGLILSGARPVYLMPEYLEEWGIYGSVTPEAVEEGFRRHPDCSAVLLVSPTYNGICSDLRSIAQICHRYGALLLVDEAHGAHFAFSDKLPESALRQGADLCAQSIHKVTGSLTQSSMLQLGSSRVDRARVDAELKLVQSTSPSYLLMASLDAARYELALHGEEMTDHALSLAKRLRGQLVKIPGIRVLTKDGKCRKDVYDLDITRVTFSAKEMGIDGFALAKRLFEEYQVSTEMSDHENVLAIVTYANTESDIDRLTEALEHISQSAGRGKKMTDEKLIPGIPQSAMTPREAHFGKKKRVSWTEAKGCIAGELLAPYPPGIPLVYPGEYLTEEIWSYLEYYRRAGHHLHGPSDETLSTFLVMEK